MQPSTHPSLSATEPVRDSRYFPALTGLRAVAAYLVFLHHYNPASPGTFAYRLFFQGYIGVSIFFVLSGFLIYHRYADRYRQRMNWSWRRYGQNRFAQLFPLYSLLLLITVGMQAATGHPMNLGLLGLNLTLLKGFFEAYQFSGIAQSWSLTVEVCFYLFAPFLFGCLQRWGAFRLTAGLVGFGLLVGATLGQTIEPGESTRGLFGNWPFVMFYTFFGRAFEFVVGMWLARRWHQNQLPQVRLPLVIGPLVMAGCVSWQASIPTLTSRSMDLFWSEVVSYNYILPVGIGIFFLGLIGQSSMIQKALTQPVMQAAGRSSYAFYLIHIGVIARGLQKTGVTDPWLLFGLLILTAYGVYRFIEKPFRKYLRP